MPEVTCLSTSLHSKSPGLPIYIVIYVKIESCANNLCVWFIVFGTYIFFYIESICIYIYIYISEHIMYMYTHSSLQSLYLQCTCKIGSRNSFGYIKQPSSHDSLSNEVSRARSSLAGLEMCTFVNKNMWNKHQKQAKHLVIMK